MHKFSKWHHIGNAKYRLQGPLWHRPLAYFSYRVPGGFAFWDVGPFRLYRSTNI